jgi:hypothetical protein
MILVKLVKIDKTYINRKIYHDEKISKQMYFVG